MIEGVGFGRRPLHDAKYTEETALNAILNLVRLADQLHYLNSSGDKAQDAAKMGMVELAEAIIAVLAADPNAEVKVTVEIQVNFPTGASDQTKRAVTENARALNFKNADWE